MLVICASELLLNLKSFSFFGIIEEIMLMCRKFYVYCFLFNHYSGHNFQVTSWSRVFRVQNLIITVKTRKFLVFYEVEFNLRFYRTQPPVTIQSFILCFLK